jgi:phosphoserine aminotransferase
MTRAVFNFSPGPALLPEPVLRQASAEMLDWRGTGMSVMEMSHRGPHFMSIYEQAIADLRELLAIPADYEVLFMQGGALAQNALVPLNLLGEGGRADYLITGQWSLKSAQEARRYGTIQVVADAATTGRGYTRVPDPEEWVCSPHARYWHYCANETIDGVEFLLPSGPDSAVSALLGSVPVVADMSSNILSRVIDVSRYGLIYGGAQKNIGPAGLTIVVVRRDLLGCAHPLTPSALNYQVVAQSGSMYNTPPTYGIYLAGLVFQWIKQQGGVRAIEAINQAKAELLYQAIDRSALYVNRVEPLWRSRMNVPFFLRDERLHSVFLEQAAQAGLVQLKGHRLVGGLRASLYNAMPMEGVQALVAFMNDFEQRHA